MNKIRQLYVETQNNCRNHFDKVTLERCKKILAYVNRQYQNSTAKNDYTDLQELIFYQDKFTQITEKFNMAINDKTKKPKLQADIINILSLKYGEILPRPNLPQQQHSNIKPQVPIDKKQKNQKVQIPQHKPKQIQQNLIKMNLNPRDLLHSYFDSKKNEIQKSKIGFKSVLENVPQTSHKYAIKSKIQSKLDKDSNITFLNKQVDQLSKKLQKSKLDHEFNHGLQEIQKKQYENRIRALLWQIQRLNRQNERLKNQAQIMANSCPTQFIQPVESVHIIEPFVSKQKVHYSQVYDPWSIKYKHNNIFQISKKFHGLQSQQISPVLQPLPNVSPVIKVAQKLQYKTTEQQILHKGFPEPNKYIPIGFQTEFQKSNIRLNRSELQNQQKNIAIRSKLSFFKSSLVLYRCDEFQLAVKSVDIVPLQSRKITIYINNKDRFTKKLSINYICDPAYYQLRSLNKLVQVQGLKQGKQQIEVTLKNKLDLDFLVEAKLNINNKSLKFILPTMMIQFFNSRPPNIVKQIYQKNTIVPPMFQFSNIFTAMQILPIQKKFEDKLDVGIIYARSKYFQGFIYLRWRSKIQLQIETIKPWILFLSYILYKEY